MDDSVGNDCLVPRVWPAFTAIAVAVALTIVLTIGLLATTLILQGQRLGDLQAIAFAMEQSLREPTLLAWSVLLSSIAIATPALGGAFCSPAPNRLRWRNGFLTGMQVTLIGVAGILCLGHLVVAFLRLLSPPITGSIADMSRIISSASPPTMLVLGVLVGVVSPVAEELLFRGYVQTRLVERWGRWPGILVTSTAFALIHLDLLHAILVFPTGLYLGWLSELTGSIRVCVVAHIVNNLVWITTVAGNLEIPLHGGVLASVAVMGALLSVVSLHRRARSRKRNERPVNEDKND